MNLPLRQVDILLHIVVETTKKSVMHFKFFRVYNYTSTALWIRGVQLFPL